MIFSNLARLFAIAAFVLGLFRVLLGIAIATELVGPYEVGEGANSSTIML